MKSSLITIALSLTLIPVNLCYSVGQAEAATIASTSQIVASSMPSSLNKKQQLIFQVANLEVMEAMESAIYRQDHPRIQYIKNQRKTVIQRLQQIDPTDQRKQIRLTRNRIVKQEVASLEKQIKTRSLRFSKNSPEIMVLREQITNLRKLTS